MAGWAAALLPIAKAFGIGAASAGGSAIASRLIGGSAGGVSTPGVARDETADQPIEFDAQAMAGVSNPQGNPSTGASPAGSGWLGDLKDYGIGLAKTAGSNIASSLTSGATRKYIDPLFRDSPGVAQRKYLQEAYPGTNPWEHLGAGQGGSASAIEYSKQDTAKYIAELDYMAKSAGISVAARQAGVQEARVPSEIQKNMAAAKKTVQELDLVRASVRKIDNDINIALRQLGVNLGHLRVSKGELDVKRGQLNVNRGQLEVAKRHFNLAVKEFRRVKLPQVEVLKDRINLDSTKAHMDWARHLNDMEVQQAKLALDATKKMIDALGHVKHFLGVGAVATEVVGGALSSLSGVVDSVLGTEFSKKFQGDLFPSATFSKHIKGLREALDRRGVDYGKSSQVDMLPMRDVETGEIIDPGHDGKPTFNLPRY